MKESDYINETMRFTPWMRGLPKSLHFVVYGAASPAREMCGMIEDDSRHILVGRVYEGDAHADYGVSDLKTLKDKEYDFMIVTDKTQPDYIATKHMLLKKGIPDQKMIWMPVL